MKKTIIILAIALTAISCEKPSKCLTATLSCGATYEVCNDGMNSYYKANGKVYTCDGVDCKDAAEDLVNDSCN